MPRDNRCMYMAHVFMTLSLMLSVNTCEGCCSNYSTSL